MGLENPTHWIPIIVVLLLIFGARRLPEIGRSLGAGLREFKQSIGGENEREQATSQQQPTSQQAPAAAAAAEQPAAAQQPAAQAQEAFAQREPAAGDRG